MNPKCATCPKILTATDQKQRCLRCKSCRRKRNGTRTPTRFNQFSINLEKQAAREKKTQPPKESWWMTAPREAFTAEGEKRLDTKKTMLLSTSPTGVTW